MPLLFAAFLSLKSVKNALFFLKIAFDSVKCRVGHTRNYLNRPETEVFKRDKKVDFLS